MRLTGDRDRTLEGVLVTEFKPCASGAELVLLARVADNDRVGYSGEVGAVDCDRANRAWIGAGAGALITVELAVAADTSEEAGARRSIGCRPVR
jgi:hypothetical protein